MLLLSDNCVVETVFFRRV